MIFATIGNASPVRKGLKSRLSLGDDSEVKESLLTNIWKNGPFQNEREKEPRKETKLSK